ncbi:hypothetical protein [Streptomyces sp. HPF1205]|uniref:hypothetical protein n=1 Tax=Streptomyces sp. HPF1205 TaxID=2873262 RepID=UPI0027DF2EF6|nr:hypothetical protein [Streptomyces sp. HPF1205]
MAAQVLEVGAEDVAGEAALGALPQGPGIASALQIGPDGAHDRVVEGDQRFVDAEAGAVVLEGVRLAGDQAALLQDGEGVSEVTGFAAQVRGDASSVGVARRDGGEHRVVEGGVVEFGLVGEKVAGFAEQRAGGGEDRAQHPRVEVLGAGRGVVAGELATVSGGAADDRVDPQSGDRIIDPPEFGGQLVIEGGHDEFEAGPPAQGRVA